MGTSVNRRDFLKFVSMLPLLTVKWPLSLQKKEFGVNKSPNILILVFDALSAHHISFYGYKRNTMPNLERFADSATVYHNHCSGGNFTSTGTASILTGTYPWTHRAFHLHGLVDKNLIENNIFNLFNQEGYTTLGYSHNLLVTSLIHQFRTDIDDFIWTRELCLSDDQLSDILFSNDFDEAFWSEWLLMRGGETKPASLFFSLAHRFFRSAHKNMHLQEYGNQFPRGIPNLHNLFFVLEDAIDWLMNRLITLQQPYLVYYHVLPPHEPYTTRHDFIDNFADGWQPKPKPESFFTENHSFESLNKERQEYDEYIAYADSEFGRLYDFFRQNGVLDNTIVLVTSDHGELFERGIRGHVTSTLYQPGIKVPLLISSPGQSQREDVFETTSAVDLLPTLLSATNISIPYWCEGVVLPTFSKNSPKIDREVYSVEAKSNHKYSPLNKATIALLKDDYKLINYLGYDSELPQYELYDLNNDPEERFDIAISQKSNAEDLHGVLLKKLKEVNKPYL